jgi:hypothetical protein
MQSYVATKLMIQEYLVICGQVQWLTPVTPTAQKAETGRVQVQGGEEEGVFKTPPQPISWV